MTETVMSSNATMAAHLMASGWELHLNDSPEKTPAIWKAQREGDTTHVNSCDLSHDDVIDLQQTGRLVMNRSFGCGNETVTVFKWRSGE